MVCCIIGERLCKTVLSATEVISCYDWAHVQVCAKAGLEPSAVDYIEAHGTGTVAGDGQELGALEEWYGRTGGRTPENPLLIGSVKSNMGHCEGCSGLAGELFLPLSTSCT